MEHAEGISAFAPCPVLICCPRYPVAMTRNPYSHTQPVDEGPTRVSGLAVAGLVVSILGCVPGLGLVGAVLSVASLPGISRSQGRVGGRTLAFMGIVFGLLTTMLWCGLVVGANSVVGGMAETFGKPLQAMQQGQYDSLRAVIETPSNTTIPDEQFRAFGERVTGEWGNLQGFPTGVLSYFRGLEDAGGVLAAAQEAERAQARGLDRAAPMPARFDKGLTLVVLALSENPNAAMLEDLGVRARDGSMIWFRDFKPQP